MIEKNGCIIIKNGQTINKKIKGIKTIKQLHINLKQQLDILYFFNLKESFKNLKIIKYKPANIR